MGLQVFSNLIVLLAAVFVLNSVFCVDLKTTEITTVTDATRFTTLNPEATLTPFSKFNHVKGNIIFSSGERIDGDRSVLTYIDEAQFTRETDVEVSIWYPASGTGSYTITFIQIYCDLTSDAEAYFVNTVGIGKNKAEILLAANQTYNFGYQIYIFGY